MYRNSYVQHVQGSIGKMEWFVISGKIFSIFSGSSGVLINSLNDTEI